MNHMSVPAQSIAEVLGGRRALGRKVQSTRELESVVRDGVPKAALDALVALMTAADTEVAVKIRNKIVPRATYQRVERFNLQVSETTERLARLFALAHSAFDCKEAAARFLMTAHPELQDRRPFDVALTEIGGREVEEVIERGLHGLPA